jgi:hypothetical protein
MEGNSQGRTEKRRNRRKKTGSQVDHNAIYRMDPSKLLVPREIEQELTQLRNVDRIFMALFIWQPRYGRVEQSTNISEANDLGVSKP